MATWTTAHIALAAFGLALITFVLLLFVMHAVLTHHRDHREDL